MKSTLNSKDYVAFARKFVKETVDRMGVEELKDFAINAIHEDLQAVSYTHLTLPTNTTV